MIRVLINGANGKMGQACVKAVTADPDLSLVGQCDRESHLKEAIQHTQAEVVIDFTNADSIFQTMETIIAAKAHPVIGTTGLLKHQIEQFQKQCEQEKLGGIIAPNFSLGAVLLMKCAQEIMPYFPNVEIIEMHHDGKLDSPSGTAIRTAEGLVTANTPHPPKPSKEILPGARGAIYQGIPIHSVRLPGLIAHQQILFGSPYETLTLRHDTTDRQCFMPGVLLACKKVIKLDSLVIGLETIL